jgi:hypothetical protein
MSKAWIHPDQDEWIVYVNGRYVFVADFHTIYELPKQWEISWRQDAD